MEYVTLNNGVKMPKLGYGVYQVSPDECERCVSDALAVGYRSVDTAQAYFNEEGVGRAVKKSGIPRSELFLTTKVWISNAGEKKAAASIDESLKKLDTDYIDLLLIHQPFGDYYGTYRAMEQAVKAGKVRAIGVSNFYPDRLIDLYNFCEIKPAVNQVETHVFFGQKKAHEVMKKLGVQHESWGPFAERAPLSHAERRRRHSQIGEKGAHGGKPRRVRFHPVRRGHGCRLRARHERKPLLLALRSRYGRVVHDVREISGRESWT